MRNQWKLRTRPAGWIYFDLLPNKKGDPPVARQIALFQDMRGSIVNDDAIHDHVVVMLLEAEADRQADLDARVRTSSSESVLPLRVTYVVVLVNL